MKSISTIIFISIIVLASNDATSQNTINIDSSKSFYAPIITSGTPELLLKSEQPIRIIKKVDPIYPKNAVEKKWKVEWY